MKWSRSRAAPLLLTVLLLWQVWSPTASLEEGFACVGEKREGCVDSALDDATNSRGVRAAGRRAAMLAAAAGGAPAVAEEPKTQWKRLRQIQYVAALGDPNANSGAGAENWGLWRKDPGPRGVRLYNYDKLKQRGGLAPAQWQFDDKDWWLEEHGLIMEKPEFPMPPGKYLVTGDREVTTTLLVSEKDEKGVQKWSLGDNAKLYDVQAKAKATCEAMMSAEGDASDPETLDTCMFDYCFAGRDFAAEDAIVIHEDEEAAAES